MAFSVDTSVDFSTATGYTFVAAEYGISGGVGTLDTGVAGPTTCVCPSINTTTWTTINRVAIDDAVTDTYRHKFLVSFDGGTVFYRWQQGSWLVAAIGDIATVGMTRPQLEQVRNWPLLSTGLVFALSASRTNTANAGTISGFSVYYLTGSTPEPVTVTGTEPLAAPTETMETEITEQPELPISLSYEWPYSLAPFGGNYEMRVAQALTYRLSVDAAFICVGTTRRDAVLTFLADHYTVPFTWTTCPLETGAAFTAGEPTVSDIDVGVYRVSCKLTQAFVV